MRALLSRLPEEDDILAADRRQAARVLAERARIATESFQRRGAAWDEMNALDLPAEAVAQALLAALPTTLGRLLDIGTGTGQMLELLAPRIEAGLGIDASRAMLALARARLSRPGLTHCAVKLGDMYRLPIADRSYDHVVLQMVLHYAEDPAAALTEACRVLRPGGSLVIIDLAAHDNADCMTRLAHRWPGFSDERIAELCGAELVLHPSLSIPGPLEVRLWIAARLATPADVSVLENAQ